MFVTCCFQFYNIIIKYNTIHVFLLRIRFHGLCDPFFYIEHSIINCIKIYYNYKLYFIFIHIILIQKIIYGNIFSHQAKTSKNKFLF